MLCGMPDLWTIGCSEQHSPPLILLLLISKTTCCIVKSKCALFTSQTITHMCLLCPRNQKTLTLLFLEKLCNSRSHHTLMNWQI